MLVSRVVLVIALAGALSGCRGHLTGGPLLSGPAYIVADGEVRTGYMVTAVWDEGWGYFSNVRGPFVESLQFDQNTDPEVLRQRQRRSLAPEDSMHALGTAASFLSQLTSGGQKRRYWVLSLDPPVLGWQAPDTYRKPASSLRSLWPLVSDEELTLPLTGYVVGKPSLWRRAKSAQNPEDLGDQILQEVILAEPMTAEALMQTTPWNTGTAAKLGG